MTETPLESADVPSRSASDRPSHTLLIRITVGLLIAILAGITLPPFFLWQRMGQQRAASLSNIRRIAQGALLYTQDWDGLPVPLETRLPSGQWNNWPRLLQPYLQSPSIFSNPANPLDPFHSRIHDPEKGYPIDSAYALNRRFWGTFGPGPFPFNDLELPESTAFFVEAGPMWEQPAHTEHASPFGLQLYGDTTDRYRQWIPYPSTHDGKMVVAAADGHGALIKVEHYGNESREHNPLYGRLGGDIYNWNGGHPNGETDRPPRE